MPVCPFCVPGPEGIALEKQHLAAKSGILSMPRKSVKPGDLKDRDTAEQ